MLHRSRDLLMRQRTMILNAIRAQIAEFGMIAAQGPRKVVDLVRRLSDPDGGLNLPALARSALLSLAAPARKSLAGEIGKIERQLMAWHRQERCEPAARDRFRAWASLTCHGARGQRSRSVRLQVGPAVCGLARARATTELLRREGSARACLEDGQRLSAPIAGCRRHLGDPARAHHRHPDRGLGQIPA